MRGSISSFFPSEIKFQRKFILKCEILKIFLSKPFFQYRCISCTHTKYFFCVTLQNEIPSKIFRNFNPRKCVSISPTPSPRYQKPKALQKNPIRGLTTPPNPQLYYSTPKGVVSHAWRVKLKKILTKVFKILDPPLLNVQFFFK